MTFQGDTIRGNLVYRKGQSNRFQRKCAIDAVLKVDRCILSYCHANGKQRTIDLQGAVLYPYVEKKQNHELAIFLVKAGDQYHLFQATDECDKWKWVKGIQTSLLSTTLNPSDMQSSGRQNRRYASIVDTEQEIVGGRLHIRTGILRRWSLVDAIISTTSMSYVTGPVSRKVINLCNCTLLRDVGMKGIDQPTAFGIRTPEKDYLFRAANERQKRIWVGAIAYVLRRTK